MTRALLLLGLVAACRATHAPEQADFAAIATRGDVLVARSAVRTYADPARGGRVVVLAMCHFGAPSYYAGLEGVLRGADVVLHEGRRPSEPAPDPLPGDLGWYERRRVIGTLAGLERQEDWEQRIVDGRWRSADLTWAEIDARADQFAFSDEQKRWVEELERCATLPVDHPDRQSAVSRCYRDLVAGIARPWRTGPERWEELHREREMRMLAALRDAVREHPGGTVVLVVGAVHAWALEPRLCDDLGLRLETAAWHEIFSVDRATYDGPADAAE